MKIRRIILAIGAVFCLSSQAQETEDAFTAVANMRVGWNLGNTLDSNSGDATNMWIEKWSSRTPKDYETAWGQPLTTRALIHMFKEAGFNAIRVPVTWYPHYGNMNNNGLTWDMGKWSGYTLNAAWMKRVKEIVGYVLDEGMYCILNVHHDTGGGSTAWIKADMDSYEQYRERYETLWTQLAKEFADCDERLLFESYNEMLDKYGSWCFASFAGPGNYNATDAAAAYKAVNSYAQSFVNAVRSTGGRNATRNLVVNTYAACDGHGNWNQHLLDPLKQMALPEDPAGKGHIVFQVHSYWNSNNYNAPMKSEITTTFTNLNTYLIKKHNAPVIIGEWGVDAEVDWNNATQTKNITDFARYFTERAKARGITCFYWMTLSDGADRSKPTWTHEALKDAVIKGYYGDGGYMDAIVAPEATHGNALPYSLGGARLGKIPAKGMYIQNGKTYVR